jgi:hypothetical protein
LTRSSTFQLGKRKPAPPSHVFQLGVVSKPKVEKPKIPAPEKTTTAEPPVPAPFGSSLEYRVYRALLTAGWKPEQIELQSAIAGGRKMRGGEVVDMILHTPYPIPIMINGNYWHKNSDKQIEDEDTIMQDFGRLPVVIWGNEAENDQDALAVVLRKIGRGSA